jgi:phosphoglycerate dehydrogenase-like enzyme
MHKLRGMFLLDAQANQMVYAPEERRAIEKLVDLVVPDQTSQTIGGHLHLLSDVQVMFSGWGIVRADLKFLNAVPNLRAIFYAAGGLGHWATDELWKRGIIVTSAVDANSIPVAEYTVACIIFSLKHGWKLVQATRDQRNFPPRDGAPGCYHRTVGLVSMGTIARKVVELLKPLQLHVLAYDPYITAAEALALGVERVALDELFARSDVVSLHTPHLKETEGLITGKHLASMKPGSTFINTARGEVVREEEMIEVLCQRSDLQAVLDVTAPEPPQADSPLYTLPNVVLTPHIAGSVGPECRRMGRCMVEELERYVAGQPLKWQVTPERAQWSIHRPEVELFVKPKSGLKSAKRPTSLTEAVEAG